MKQIIKWLADVSGVTRQIQIQEMKELGGRMYQDHYWWNGGITFMYGKPAIQRAFELYALDMKEGKYPDIQTIREKVYKEFPKIK